MPITLLGRRRSKKRKASKTICRKGNGRLKKGWRVGKGGRCIKAKGKKARRKRR